MTPEPWQSQCGNLLSKTATGGNGHSNAPVKKSISKTQRVMFLQGQRCFFCDHVIPKEEQTLEHLIPVSGGGNDHPDNLVGCCKTLNEIFGNMSVKEKIRAILNQRGKFVCPNQPAPPRQTSPAPAGKLKPASGV